MDYLEKLRATLEDESVQKILAEPDVELTPSQIDGLEQLHVRFVDGTERANPEGEAGGSSEEADHPVERFLELAEDDLKLHPCIKSYLPAAQFDPKNFFNDNIELEGGLGYWIKRGTSDAPVRRVLLYMVQQHRKLKEQKEHDHHRLLFRMLMMFDIVRCIWPNEPSRIGRLTHQNLQENEAMSKTIEALWMNGTELEEFRSNLNEWSVLGSKLDFICREYGPGSLFLIGNCLSINFLKDKFTDSGDRYEEGKAHLLKLGIRLKAHTSGANQMAQKIRDFLVAPFMTQD